MTAPRAEVRIEQLVLDGFGSVDLEAVKRSLEQSLTALLAERPLSPTLSRDVAALAAGGFELRPGATAASIGVRTARAVHRGLTR